MTGNVDIENVDIGVAIFRHSVLVYLPVIENIKFPPEFRTHAYGAYTGKTWLGILKRCMPWKGIHLPFPNQDMERLILLTVVTVVSKGGSERCSSPGQKNHAKNNSPFVKSVHSLLYTSIK